MTDPTRPGPGSPTNDGTDPAMPPALHYIRRFTDDAGETWLTRNRSTLERKGD